MSIQNFNLKACPEGELYDRLREIDLAVIASARHFQIDESLIDDFLLKLPRMPESALLSDDYHLIDPDDIERTLNYLFCVESVNFGGPYSPMLKAEGFVPEGSSLYITVARRLKNHFEREDAMPPRKMASLTLADVRNIFEVPDKPVSNTIAGMFRESLQETGLFVQNRFDGKFGDLLTASEGSVERFVRTMWELPKFRDVHNYPMSDGIQLEVPILKRAQHIAGSLPLALARMGRPPPFSDLDKLTAFPDNKISHVMMVEGLLIPTPATLRQINSGHLFAIGSPAEIENRICGRHLIRLMSERSGIPQVELDHWTWENSHGNSLLSSIPYASRKHLVTDAPSFNY